MKKSAKPKPKKNSRKPRNSKNNFKPILDRLDKLNEGMNELKGGVNELGGRVNELGGRVNELGGRMDKLESRMDVIETKVDAVQQETAALRKEMKEENQNLRAEIVKYYFAALDEVEKIASETDKKWNHMLTMLDGVAKDYENWRDEKLVITVELDEHGREIEALNQKDAKKETAIQDLQQRVTTLENAGDGKPPTPEPSIKE